MAAVVAQADSSKQVRDRLDKYVDAGSNKKKKIKAFRPPKPIFHPVTGKKSFTKEEEEKFQDAQHRIHDIDPSRK